MGNCRQVLKFQVSFLALISHSPCYLSDWSDDCGHGQTWIWGNQVIKYVGVKRPPVVAVLWFVFSNWVFGSGFWGLPLDNVLKTGHINQSVPNILYCIFFIIICADHFVTGSIEYLLVHTVLFAWPNTLLAINWPGYAQGLQWKIKHFPIWLSWIIWPSIWLECYFLKEKQQNGILQLCWSCCLTCDIDRKFLMHLQSSCELLNRGW